MSPVQTKQVRVGRFRANVPHIVICRVHPVSPYRDLSCFAIAYGNMTETCFKKNDFRNDSPECATDTSGNVLWEIRLLCIE